MRKTHILIPTDLSDVGDKAIEFGGMIGTKLNSEITLVHIIPPLEGTDTNRNLLSGQRVFRALEEQLQENVNDIQKSHGIKAEFMLKEGHIFEQISEVATEVDSAMIVIGTHGKKIIQYLTGSYMAKVIASSEVPVLVVKKNSEAKAIKELFVGLDFEGSSDKMLTTVELLATNFGAKVNFISSESQRGALLEVREIVHGKVAYEHEFTLVTETDNAFIKKVCDLGNAAEGGMAVFKLEDPNEEARFQRLEKLLAGNQHPLPVIYVYSGQ